MESVLKFFPMEIFMLVIGSKIARKAKGGYFLQMNLSMKEILKMIILTVKGSYISVLAQFWKGVG